MTATAERMRSGLNALLRKPRNSVAVFCLGFAITCGALPSVAEAQNFRFSSVKIEGSERIDPATILSYAGIARGQTITGGDLNAAYQRIQGSGLFESVELVPSGNTLIIKVTEFPTVNRINFEGNRRLKDEDLQAIVTVQSRRVFNPATVETDVAAITQAYVDRGRVSARVTPRIIKRSNNRVDVIYEIREGALTEIERIGFVGNRAYSDGRLRRVLETKQAGILRTFVQRDTFVADRIEFDKQVLRDFYFSRGYIDFRTTGVNAEIAQERDGYFLTFNIQEGQQFSFGEVAAISDLAEVDVELFQSQIKSRPGVVYSPTLVERDIARLEKLAIKEGLNFIRVEPRISRNDRDLTLDIEYVITKGPRIFVERIDIEGNTTTLDRVVRRQFLVAEGDPFNPREIRESAERIRALGYFSAAEVNAREGSSPQQVIVDVNVEEQPTGSLSFGGTYSTATGFGANVAFSERNFLGRGQTLNLSVSTGVDNRNYTLNFVEPAFLGRRDVAFGLSLAYSETDNQNASYDTASGIFQPSLAFPVNESTRLSVRYASDMSEITNAAADAGGIVTAEEGRGRLWAHSLGYTLTYDSRRTGLNPNAGLLLEFGQDFGLHDNDQFVKTTARAVAQTKILNEEVTLRATLEGGMLNYSGQGSRVTERFFMGSNIMRGFEPGGIGPREYNAGAGVDEALGGNIYAVARFEAEFPLGLPEEYGITGGVFYDVGSLWGLDQNNADVLYEDSSLRQTAGLSIFWNTPIGPLRFNFSEPIRKEARDKAQRFELTLSTQF